MVQLWQKIKIGESLSGSGSIDTCCMYLWVLAVEENVYLSFKYRSKISEEKMNVENA